MQTIGSMPEISFRVLEPGNIRIVMIQFVKIYTDRILYAYIFIFCHFYCICDSNITQEPLMTPRTFICSLFRNHEIFHRWMCEKAECAQLYCFNVNLTVCQSSFSHKRLITATSQEHCWKARLVQCHMIRLCYQCDLNSASNLTKNNECGVDSNILCPTWHAPHFEKRWTRAKTKLYKSSCSWTRMWLGRVEGNGWEQFG